MKSIIFFYLMNDDKDNIKNTAPKHSDYWNRQKLENYKGGPFADYSGGCITFSSISLDSAHKIAMADPFITNNCLKSYWIQEWMC